MLADWFQLPSHGNVGTCSRLPGVYRDLPRLAEVPEFEWSVPMVLMPFVRLLRSQDFVPFVLLCLALALPRGCMWLQAALVGVLLLYLWSLDVSRSVYFALCKAHGLPSADNCISQPFTSFNTISKYLKYLNLRSHLGKPWETHVAYDVTWCDMQTLCTWSSQAGHLRRHHQWSIDRLDGWLMPCRTPQWCGVHECLGGRRGRAWWNSEQNTPLSEWN